MTQTNTLNILYEPKKQMHVNLLEEVNPPSEEVLASGSPFFPGEETEEEPPLPDFQV